MSKKLIPKKIFIALITIILVQGCSHRAKDWNVLIITLDTTRADRIGCYGYGKARTPNLDRLAQEGVKFENAYCQVPLTLPSHCSIFTGTYPLFHGVRNNGSYKLSDKIETLAEVLRSRGWKTSAFVASFSLDSRFGLDQGFEVYDDEMGEERIKTFLSERRAVEVYEAFRRWYRGKGEGKWFCWVHFYDPHLPYDPPEPWRREIEDRYDGEIAYMDEYVGKVLEEVEGERDRTLIVIVGDHGESLGEHGEIQHGFFLYEPVLRVPLIFVKKGELPKGKSIKARVRLIDIMPTILSSLKIPLPKGIDGTDLKPYIKKGRQESLPSYIETLYPEEAMGWSRLTGFIKGEWKLIIAPEPELYNLSLDPEEKVNLYNSEIKIRDDLKASLDDILSKYSTSQSGGRKISQEELERLKSLGYILAEGKVSPSENLPDPKKRIEVVKIIENAQISEFENQNIMMVELYKKLVSLEPYCTFGYTSLAEGYMKLRDANSAIQTIKKGLELMPQSFLLWSTLGKIYFKIENLEDSLSAFQKALSINPDDFDSLYFSGWILNRIGKKEDALKMLEKALKIEPENRKLRQDYAVTLAENGKVEEALSILNELLNKFPEDPSIYRDIAITYFTIKDYEKAILFAERGLKIKESSELFRVLAIIYDEMGKKEKAKEYMRLFEKGKERELKKGTNF
jgi:arylsulfatase A-like enzyme/Tfp pilus assembly protein PilF